MTYNILFFIIYAFLGWVLEVIYTRFDEHRWVNRGFLHGPFCPIYGLGAVSCLIFLAPLQTNMYLFVPITMIIATSLEFFISWFFESVFHVTLWSYYHRKFNYKGRICLEFTILWGIIGVIFIKLVHPYISRLVFDVPPRYIHMAFVVLSTVLMIDLILSVAVASVSTERLERLERIDGKIKESNEELKNATGTRLEMIQEKLTELNELRSSLLEYTIKKGRRLFNAFPTMKSSRFPHALDYLKERVNKVNLPRPFGHKKEEDE